MSIRGLAIDVPRFFDKEVIGVKPTLPREGRVTVPKRSSGTQVPAIARDLVSSLSRVLLSS